MVQLASNLRDNRSRMSKFKYSPAPRSGTCVPNLGPTSPTPLHSRSQRSKHRWSSNLLRASTTLCSVLATFLSVLFCLLFLLISERSIDRCGYIEETVWYHEEVLSLQPMSRCDYIGEPVWYHEEVLSLQPMSRCDHIGRLERLLKTKKIILGWNRTQGFNLLAKCSRASRGDSFTRQVSIPMESEARLTCAC